MSPGPTDTTGAKTPMRTLPEVHISTARLIDTDALADRVRNAILTAPAAERFGERKVYLSWVMATTGATPAQLVALHKRKAITMVRADSPMRMDIERYKASYVADKISEYEFAIDPTKP